MMQIKNNTKKPVRITIGQLVERAKIRDEKEKQANMEYHIPGTSVILVSNKPNAPVEPLKSLPSRGDIIRELQQLAKMCAVCEVTGCNLQVSYKGKHYYVCEEHARSNVLRSILEKTSGY